MNLQLFNYLKMEKKYQIMIINIIMKIEFFINLWKRNDISHISSHGKSNIKNIIIDICILEPKIIHNNELDYNFVKSWGSNYNYKYFYVNNELDLIILNSIN